MKHFVFLGICLLLIISSIPYGQSDSSCTSNCDDDCSSSNCSSGCTTDCQRPCRKRCNNNECRSKCDVKEPEEPVVQKTKEILITPQKDSGSKTNSVNDIKNDYNVNINPNITLTNTISNINNISVPINVTSINMNNIRVSTADARSTQTNITAGGCSGKNPPPDCGRNQRPIIILPYPQRTQLPPPQPRVIVQPIVREPIIVQAPQTPPPPQRIPIIVPTPIIQQNPVPVPVPVQPQPIVQPIPQYYWFSQQYIRQPQQTIIAQPQQQVIYTPQPQPCGSPEGLCGSSCLNQPCSSRTQQMIPINYGIPSSTCQGGGCPSKFMYALTSPYISSNQVAQYSGVNPYYARTGLPQYGAIGSIDARNGLSQYGAIGSVDARNGLSQMGALTSYASRNGVPQYNNFQSNFMNQLPVGVDSYFIPDQLSSYQIQGGNSTKIANTSN
ncbi:uncharacterized protein LOC123682321 [Harmonia axyridis]|uniref:uncharacterized protein LOC123682321 n=1 Tax=Harmonia axyridis TaxID=115357 RepID=UPI001E27664B|nr:uncharacterized protein LOC123682321 [Harmonia axyridis]